jgi:hypothetical protein
MKAVILSLRLMQVHILSLNLMQGQRKDRLELCCALGGLISARVRSKAVPSLGGYAVPQIRS